MRIRAEPMSNALQQSDFPTDLGAIVDIAPIQDASRSVWLLLSTEGSLIRLDADSRAWQRLASCTVQAEPDREAFNGHTLRRKLHASPCGRFAAVVNDYGQFGQILDLQLGLVTLPLDGGDDDPETVPFSFAFATLRGRTVAIHRTDSNRLDVSDPASGQLLTSRGPTGYRAGEKKPDHLLDYYHGALHLSPDGRYVLCNGWVWHPVGVPVVWSLEAWLTANVWESEDGPSKAGLCSCGYYWDRPACWLDGTRLALGGLGDEDTEIQPGARIFELIPLESTQAEGEPTLTVCEPIAFSGPAGAFFSDGKALYSSDDAGLSRWDPVDGARTGHLPGFGPTHHHPYAEELAECSAGGLRRWSTRG